MTSRSCKKRIWTRPDAHSGQSISGPRPHPWIRCRALSPDPPLPNDSLDVVNALDGLFDRPALRLRTHTAQHEHPTALTEHPEAGARKTLVLLREQTHPGDDLGVVQIGIGQPAATRTVATGAALCAPVGGLTRLSQGLQGNGRLRTSGHPLTDLQKRVLGVPGLLGISRPHPKNGGQAKAAPKAKPIDAKPSPEKSGAHPRYQSPIHVFPLSTNTIGPAIGAPTRTPADGPPQRRPRFDIGAWRLDALRDITPICACQY